MLGWINITSASILVILLLWLFVMTRLKNDLAEKVWPYAFYYLCGRLLKLTTQLLIWKKTSCSLEIKLEVMALCHSVFLLPLYENPKCIIHLKTKNHHFFLFLCQRKNVENVWNTMALKRQVMLMIIRNELHTRIHGTLFMIHNLIVAFILHAWYLNEGRHS